MEPLRLVELIAAALIVGVGIALYRRKPVEGNDGGYGSQGAVLLFVLAAIIGIHALGGLDYHPTDAERDYIKAHAG